MRLINYDGELGARHEAFNSMAVKSITSNGSRHNFVDRREETGGGELYIDENIPGPPPFETYTFLVSPTNGLKIRSIDGDTAIFQISGTPMPFFFSK